MSVVPSSSPPPVGLALPRQVLTHRLTADTTTAERLARTVLRVTLLRPAVATTALLTVLVGVVLDLLVGQTVWGTAAALLTVAATPGLTLRRLRRRMRALAPPHVELAAGYGPTHLLVRTAAGSRSLPWAGIRSARHLGDVVVFTTSRGDLLPLPDALFGPDLAAVIALAGETADTSSSPVGESVGPTPLAPVPSTSDPAGPRWSDVLLPWSLTITPEHQDRLLRAVAHRSLLRRHVLVAVALCAAIWPLTAARHELVPLAALVTVAPAAMLTLLLRAGARLRAHRRVGDVLRAGFLGAELVVQDRSGIARVPWSGLRAVVSGHGVVQLLTTDGRRQLLPEGLVPDLELDRMRAVLTWQASSR